MIGTLRFLWNQFSESLCSVWSELWTQSSWFCHWGSSGCRFHLVKFFIWALTGRIEILQVLLQDLRFSLFRIELKSTKQMKFWIKQTELWSSSRPPEFLCFLYIGNSDGSVMESEESFSPVLEPSRICSLCLPSWVGCTWFFLPAVPAGTGN